MRIISGNFRGKKIFFPDGKNTRPLRDMVKESIFNLIENSNKFKLQISKSNILDLFSGSGSFGLECLSRGAKNVIFFENYFPTLKILKKKILNKYGIIIIHRHKRDDLEITPKLNILDTRLYGISKIIIGN